MDPIRPAVAVIAGHHNAGEWPAGPEARRCEMTTTPSVMLKNLATGTWSWFSQEAIDRAVECNGGPEGDTCLAMMPEDWPSEAGEFADESNIWLLHPADETF